MAMARERERKERKEFRIDKITKWNKVKGGFATGRQTH